ncbi:calcitonin gene-related peptide type 1 receptor isoform X2 [Anabrus simplex]|uniref:calcitonin gene-related peptide type 1 receptor isoform X2 n=1 Tax=Anabrus simplex TaxID=316456 RepID=UPI0035A36D27
MSGWMTVILTLAMSTICTAAEEEPLCRVANQRQPNGILLPREKFARYACALCYKYSSNSFFTKDSRWIVVDDVDNYPMKIFKRDNMTVRDPDSQELYQSFRPDSPGVEKWRSCCHSAEECCNSVLSLSTGENEDNSSCPRLWDGWQCWRDAPSPSEQRQFCPDYIISASNPGGNCSRFASRRCEEGGQWRMRSSYETCMRLDADRRHNYVLIGAYIASVIMLVPALAIFCLYEQLHGHRISLHRNLFCSLLLHALAEMTFRCTVVLSELSLGPSVAAENGVECRLLLAVTKYLRSSNYMWMFCEGFHLHRLISVAFASEGSFLIFYLIGWGIPIVPTTIYVILRILYHDSACWMEENPYYEWILLVPNLLSLLVNMVLLTDIVRIMVTVARRSVHHQEAPNYRKTVRATLVLVPLFGVNFVLTLYRPDPRFCIWREVYLYADHLLDGLQGALVSLNFCFFNSEVHSVMKRSYRTLIDRYHPGLHSSRGSHSFMTMQTTF